MPGGSARRHLPARNGELPPPIFEAETGEAPRHLRDYLSVLYKHRWLAIACFGATVSLTILVTLLTPRLYTASTRLQVAPQSPIQLRLDGNVIRVPDGDRDANRLMAFVSAQAAALRSRDLAERVIRERGLASNQAFLDPRPRRRGLGALAETLPRLVRPRGLENAPAGSAAHEAGSRTSAAPDLIDRYMRYLTVEEVRGTDIVEVRFATPDPSLSALLAAAHTQAYLDTNEEARRANDVTAQEFLGRQLEETRQQVERTEAALSRFAAEHPNVAVNEEQKTVAQRITDLSKQLTDAEGARLSLQSRYKFLGEKPHGDLLAYFLDRPGLQKLHLALLDIREQRAGLEGRLGPRHPQVQELRRQQAEIEAQLRAEVEQEVEAIRTRYDAAKSSQEVADLLQVPTLATIPNFEQARRAAMRGPYARRLPAPSDGNGRAASNGQGTTDTLDGHGDLVILREPWSQVAEAFRSLRTAVLFTAHGAPPKVIVVTSAVAAEGKTVGSLNLATALAETGSRVLLLEADLRHPRCHRTLGVNAH